MSGPNDPKRSNKPTTKSKGGSTIDAVKAAVAAGSSSSSSASVSASKSTSVSVSTSQGGGGASGSASASMQLDVGGSAGGGAFLQTGFSESEFEAMWAKVSKSVHTSFEVEDTDTVEQEARYWDQLEHSLMKGYTQRLKTLAMQVARVELMVRTYTSSLETRFMSAFATWQSHFDARLKLVTDQLPEEGWQQQIVNVKVDIDNSVNAKIEQKFAAYVGHADFAKLIHNHFDVHWNNHRDEFRRLLWLEIEQHIEAHVHSHWETHKQDIDVHIKNHWELHKSEFEAEIWAKLQAHIDASVKNVVQIGIGQYFEDNGDITELRASIRMALSWIVAMDADIRSDVSIEINTLQEWVVAQILQIKGCLTDRDVLVSAFTEFSHGLTVKLNDIACVNPNIWAKTHGNGGEGGHLFDHLPLGFDDLLKPTPGLVIPDGPEQGGEQETGFIVPEPGSTIGGPVTARVFKPGANMAAKDPKGDDAPVLETSVSGLTFPLTESPTEFPGARDKGGALVPDFGAEFAGYITIARSGGYEFRLTAAETATLWVGGKKIGRRGTAERPSVGAVELGEGAVPFRIEFWKTSGELVGLELAWKAPGDDDWSPVPDSAFDTVVTIA